MLIRADSQTFDNPVCIEHVEINKYFKNLPYQVIEAGIL
jgi:hypothetical protein